MNLTSVDPVDFDAATVVFLYPMQFSDTPDRCLSNIGSLEACAMLFSIFFAVAATTQGLLVFLYLWVHTEGNSDLRSPP